MDVTIRWVNAYDTNRSYGGPEEGGWWYETGQLLATIPCTTDEEVATALAQLNRILRPQFEGNHPIGSVLCEGVLHIIEEEETGADYPTERPHYE